MSFASLRSRLLTRLLTRPRKHAFAHLLLITLFLTGAPVQVQAADLPSDVQQGAQPRDEESAPAAVPEAIGACASLSAVSEWNAELTFSWNDAAEGEILSHAGVASVHRQATTHQRLTNYRDFEEYERWSGFVEDAQFSGHMGVDDRAISHDGAVDYYTSGNTFVMDSNFNMAELNVYANCTYDLDFGFEGRVVNTAGGLPPQNSTLLLGYVFLRGLAVPDSQFDVALAGSMSVPYDRSAIDSEVTAFNSGADPGQNWIDTFRDGPTFADAHVTWRLTPAGYLPCRDRTSAIDASDPNLDNLRFVIDAEPAKVAPNQGNSLQPPDPVKLTIRALCGLTPVRNAQIRVAVEAKKRSGGHLHENGAFPRPRGFLHTAPTGTFTEITAQTQFITVQTDSTGKATAYFRPGVDFAAGGGQACSGKQRGISGLYEVKVNSTIPRFAANEAKQVVNVARSDFTPIVAGPLIDLFNSNAHPKGTSGTAQTIAAINALAAEFNRVQVANNMGRQAGALTPWRIVKLPLVDASLQDGGLYETGGVDVCQGGQPLVPFRDWHIPHQTHMFGTAVDIKTSVWSLPADPDNAMQVAWWRNTLRAIGCNYGTWARERISFHLDVNQATDTHGQFHSGCQYVPDPLQQAMASMANADDVAQADLPDLFVTLLADAPEEEVRLAPGQSVTYSVGLSNLYGDAIAHGARISVTLPSGLSFAGSNPPGIQDGNVMGWLAGDLAANALPTLYFFAVTADAGILPNTTLTLTVEAFSSDTESTTENNEDRAALFVTHPGPDLLVESNLDEVAMTVNQPVSVTFEAQNVGNAPAPNSKLRLTLPPNTLFYSATLAPTGSGPTFVEWTLGTMEADTTQGLGVMLALDPALADSPITPLVAFATQMTTSATDTRLANNTADYIEEVVFAGHDLQVWLQVEQPEETIASGQTLTYTIVVGNFGGDAAQSPTVELTLADSMSLLGATPPASGSGPFQWTLGSLPVGELAVYEARVRVDALPSESSAVVATAHAQNSDSNLLNNRAEELHYATQASNGAGDTFIPSVMKEE